MTTLPHYLTERGAGRELSDFIESLSSSDQDLVAALIEALRPSANALGELLATADEIRLREKRETLREVFEHYGLLPVLQKRGGRKERYRLLMKRLFEVRHPLRSRLEADVERCLKEISTKYQLRPRVPEKLEGDTVEISLKIRNLRDLESFSERLKDLSADPNLEKVFQILQGKW